MGKLWFVEVMVGRYRLRKTFFERIKEGELYSGEEREVKRVEVTEVGIYKELGCGKIMLCGKEWWERREGKLGKE